MKIELHELDWAQAAQILEIACKHNIALYDASYLFLTEEIKAQLVTADKTLYETTKDYFTVLNIEEYKQKTTERLVSLKNSLMPIPMLKDRAGIYVGSKKLK